MSKTTAKTIALADMTPAQRLAYARALAAAGTPVATPSSSIKETVANVYVEATAFLPDVRALVALKRAERASEQERLLRSIG